MTTRASAPSLPPGRSFVAGFQGVDDGDNSPTRSRRIRHQRTWRSAALPGRQLARSTPDVDGVYTSRSAHLPAQPAPSSHASPYEEMAGARVSLGAKVLQIRSGRIREALRRTVHVRSSFTDIPGTWSSQRRRAWRNPGFGGHLERRTKPDHLAGGAGPAGAAARIFGPSPGRQHRRRHDHSRTRAPKDDRLTFTVRRDFVMP